MTSSFEEQRVARQLRLKGFDQEAVAASHMVVVGAGGLGCPVLQALAAAGVSHLTIVDDDVVSVSNLQRQVLFGAADVGRPKLEVARERLEAMQPGIVVDVFAERLDARNALTVLGGHDVILDCTDLFSSKYLIADAAEILGIPLVWGTVLAYEGSVAVFQTEVAGLRDLYPTAPDHLPTCAEAGVLGATTAVIGSIMATEALKLRSGLPTLLGRLLTYDALSSRVRTFALRRDASRLAASSLEAHLIPDVLLDVREAQEREENVKYAGSLHLPAAQQTPARVAALCEEHAGETIGVFCASGARAARFVSAWGELAIQHGVVLKAL
ncbi:ThiF family adenylyltransferase [Corynebacterium vitaeruminis]|uniref:ThiF family adenylyltransferase n=1 Tax=Corynebacterium vitaeruminis TaxID=38305 RepID=UPI00046C9BDE|nr:ThiF family adenylyltransferase [Corynebacterium vitaeruminis]